MNKRTITIPAKIYDGEGYLDLLKFHHAQNLPYKQLRELETEGKLDLAITVTWPHWRHATQDWSWPDMINNRLGPLQFELFEEFMDLYDQSLKYINEELAKEDEENTLDEEPPARYPSPRVLNEEIYKK